MKVKGGKAGGNVMSVVLLVVALVVAYYVVRYLMSSMDGFQGFNPAGVPDLANIDGRVVARNPDPKKINESCGPTSVKLVFANRNNVETYCFKNQQANAKIKYQDLNLPKDGPCMLIAEASTGASFYKKSKVGSAGSDTVAEAKKPDGYVANGATKTMDTCEIGSLVVYKL